MRPVPLTPAPPQDQSGLIRWLVDRVTQLCNASNVFITNARIENGSTYLRSNVSATLTAGFAHTSFNAGTKTSGTFTPAFANGNTQHVINGGAHTLDPPTETCVIRIKYTNNASAGSITTSGFNKVDGTAPSTTDGEQFIAVIEVIDGDSLLTWKALQ